MALKEFREGFNDGVKNVVVSTEVQRTSKDFIDRLKIVTSPGVTITEGDEVKLYDVNDDLVFGGYCWGSNFDRLRNIDCYDYSYELVNRLVNKVYRNMSPEAIIEDIIDSYTSLTYSSTVSTGVTISKITFKDRRAIDCINDLISLFNADWYTDKAKVFYLQLIGEQISTSTLTQGVQNTDGWKVNTDNLVTRATVVGSKVSNRAEEPFTGSFSTITLTRKPIDIRVLVGTTELTQSVDGQITGDYDVDKDNKTIDFDSSQTDPLVNYSYESQIKLSLNASADIIDQYGYVEKKYEKTYIESMSEARDYARFLLENFSEGLASSVWRTKSLDIDKYIPNQNIYVTDIIHGYEDYYLITKVVRKFPGSIEVTVGQDETDILNWQKETQERIKQIEEREDNSDLLQEYENIKNFIEIGIGTSITRYQYREIDSDSFYLLEDGGATRNQMKDDGTGPVMRENPSTGGWIDIT